MANGWYNTATTHNTAGFAVTFTANLAYVPNRDLLFAFAGFRTLKVNNSDDLPTVLGPKASSILTFSNVKDITYTHPVTQEQITQPNEIAGQFDAPAGVDMEGEIGAAFVPVPMVQFGIGTIKRTDFILRWMPQIRTDDFALDMLGIGVKHDFKQWIPRIKYQPFDASILMGYTALSAQSNLTGIKGGLAGARQIARYDIRLLTVQILASKKFSFLSVYSGLGFNRIKSNLTMTGEYIIEGNVLVDGQSVPATARLVDPIDLSFLSSGPRLTIGVRLKLLMLTLHADYTLQEYHTLTLGLGFAML